jgi:hypothetical protein
MKDEKIPLWKRGMKGDFSNPYPTLSINSLISLEVL